MFGSETNMVIPELMEFEIGKPENSLDKNKNFKLAIFKKDNSSMVNISLM